MNTKAIARAIARKFEASFSILFSILVSILFIMSLTGVAVTVDRLVNFFNPFALARTAKAKLIDFVQHARGCLPVSDWKLLKLSPKGKSEGKSAELFTFSDYGKWVVDLYLKAGTAIPLEKQLPANFSNGIAEETLELCEVVDKITDKGFDTRMELPDEELKQELVGESGDVLWYLTAFCKSLPGGTLASDAFVRGAAGINLPEICDEVIAEMESEVGVRAVQSVEARNRRFRGACLKFYGNVKRYGRGDSRLSPWAGKGDLAFESSLKEVLCAMHAYVGPMVGTNGYLRKVMTYNVEKIEKRFRNNTIRGDGEQR